VAALDDVDGCDEVLGAPPPEVTPVRGNVRHDATLV
jgi:hypothetical protein